jgi:hypothetical protein
MVTELLRLGHFLPWQTVGRVRPSFRRPLAHLRASAQWHGTQRRRAADPWSTVPIYATGSTGW